MSNTQSPSHMWCWPTVPLHTSLYIFTMATQPPVSQLRVGDSAETIFYTVSPGDQSGVCWSETSFVVFNHFSLNVLTLHVQWWFSGTTFLNIFKYLKFFFYNSWKMFKAIILVNSMTRTIRSTDQKNDQQTNQHLTIQKNRRTNQPKHS